MLFRKPFYPTLTLLFCLLQLASQAQEPPIMNNQPLRIGIVGLEHGHVHWLLERGGKDELQLLGVVEENDALRIQIAEQYALDQSVFFTSLEEMIKKTEVEAVCVFTSTDQHLEIVETCAKKGIHVMLEKPLALNSEEAKAMQKAAKKRGILVLTNYETTWYGSVQRAYKIVHEKQQLGVLKKVVVQAGHSGPKEIGVGPEFLSWLTNPNLNGGGAIMDFGCYGANLISWLAKGERPLAVTALTQQLKTDSTYAQVDDEATILIEYPGWQGIIEASWNWPDNRKRLHLYGTAGYLECLNAADMRMVTTNHTTDAKIPAPKVRAPKDDPYTYFWAAVRGQIPVRSTDLSSLELNILAMEILDAARLSAQTGQRVELH